MPTPVNKDKANPKSDCHKGTVVIAIRIGMDRGEVRGMRLRATTAGLFGAVKKMVINQAGNRIGSITKNWAWEASLGPGAMAPRPAKRLAYTR